MKVMEFLRRMEEDRWGKYILMFGMLLGVFWITIVGANYPSAVLSKVLFDIEALLLDFFIGIGAPEWLYGCLVLGAYRMLAWVVSVMLPPMLIFFPLFALLEDAGYLPRVAYHLEPCFRRCGTCGKQALTMCMGFGCNAVGVTGCRMIESPQERLLAVLTNSFVPCNGRFSALIAVITMFFIGTGTAAGGAAGTFRSALLLSLLILLSILASLAATKLLSATLLKGLPSACRLELPTCRRPQVGQVLARALRERALFVLQRAAAVAAPAGLIIWLMSNITLGDQDMLHHMVTVLEPAGQFIGLDGAILTAFILGLPANEIVLPLVIMIYTAQGTLTQTDDLAAVFQLFSENGWTQVTALCFLLFSLFHWPCSTTLLTIYKETGSWKCTLAAFWLPLVIGVTACASLSFVLRNFI